MPIRNATGAEAPIVAILLVSAARLLMERNMYGHYSAEFYPVMFVQTALFYTFMACAFGAIVAVLTQRPFANAVNAAAIGCSFGIMPPLMQRWIFTGDEARTVYFHDFTWSLFHHTQAKGESVIIWLLIISAGVYVGLVTLSWLRGLVAGVAGYVVVQVLSFGVLGALKATADMDHHVTNAVVAFGLLAASILVYVGLHLRRWLPSLSRVNHAFPHIALVACGAAWTGRPINHIYEQGAAVLFCFIVLLVHNDYFDAEEDRKSGRPVRATRDDLLWSSFFAGLCLLIIYTLSPPNALHLAIIVLLGLVYHHPSLRLKERFCLSYLVEGGWAVTAFSIGTWGTLSFHGQGSLREVCALVFFGGAMLSMIKDWKDVEGDRATGINTIYVMFARDSSQEHRVHRAVVLATFLSLIPGVAHAIGQGNTVGAIVLAAIAVLFALCATTLSSRRAVVESAMWLYAGYLATFAITSTTWA